MSGIRTIMFKSKKKLEKRIFNLEAIVERNEHIIWALLEYFNFTYRRKDPEKSVYIIKDKNEDANSPHNKP